MKRLVKYPLKLVWRATTPLRRPILRRFEMWLDRYMALSAQALTEEANMVLDFASAELARLQEQIETLTQMHEELESRNLSIVASEL